VGETDSGCSSSGLLLYAALVDLMAEDFLSEEANRTLTKKDRVMAFFFLILGGKIAPRLVLVLDIKADLFSSDRHVYCGRFCVDGETEWDPACTIKQSMPSDASPRPTLS
jgi:hypothetical protein